VREGCEGKLPYIEVTEYEYYADGDVGVKPKAEQDL
jgi:hypothetical protein